MISDDERREVARRLRYDARLAGLFRLNLLATLAYDIRTEADTREILSRLADLIDPDKLRGTRFQSIIIEPMDPPCDRDALLKLAEDIENGPLDPTSRLWFICVAHRIREALGVEDGDGEERSLG